MSLEEHLEQLKNVKLMNEYFNSLLTMNKQIHKLQIDNKLSS